MKNKIKPFLSLVFFPSLLFLFCPVTGKAAVLPVTPEQLVGEAELICIGVIKPNSMKSSWVTAEQGEKWMESDITLLVSEYLKGEGPAELTIHFFGGKIEDQVERNSVSPWFEDEEQVVLFLEKSATQNAQNNRYIVPNNFLGKYTIDQATHVVIETGDDYRTFVDKINILLKTIHP